MSALAMSADSETQIHYMVAQKKVQRMEHMKR